MLIPTLMILYIFDHRLNQCYDVAIEVKDLETRAGVRVFSNQSNENFLANTRKVIRETADLKARLADILSHLRPMKFCFFDPIVESVNTVEQMVTHAALDSDTKRQILNRGRGLEGRIQLLNQDTVIRLSHTEALMAKMETTMSAVRNIVFEHTQELATNIILAALQHVRAER